MPAGQHAQHRSPGLGTPNVVIYHVINYTCVFLAMTCQDIIPEKGSVFEFDRQKERLNLSCREKENILSVKSHKMNIVLLINPEQIYILYIHGILESFQSPPLSLSSISSLSSILPDPSPSGSCPFSTKTTAAKLCSTLPLTACFLFSPSVFFSILHLHLSQRVPLRSQSE